MHEDYISISHISKKYDKDLVLKDVNAVLHKGEILGFLGPSGAGKTTTIKILTGQLMPTSGEAKVLGIDCRRIDERIYEQIGIVSDSSGVYERMSVYDNLKYFARLLNVPLKNIDPLLKRIGLYEHKKKPAAKLSRSLRQSSPEVRHRGSSSQGRCCISLKSSFSTSLQADLTRPLLLKSTAY